MLSTLFGKKASKNANPPWDEIPFGAISLPIWRTLTRDGRARFAFGISRPWEKGGERYYARSFDVGNLWDIIGALEKLSLSLAAREDISGKDREVLMDVQSNLERALKSRQSNGAKYGNGHSEPTR